MTVEDNKDKLIERMIGIVVKAVIVVIVAAFEIIQAMRLFGKSERIFAWSK